MLSQSWIKFTRLLANGHPLAMEKAKTTEATREATRGVTREATKEVAREMAMEMAMEMAREVAMAMAMEMARGVARAMEARESSERAITNQRPVTCCTSTRQGDMLYFHLSVTKLTLTITKST